MKKTKADLEKEIKDLTGKLNKYEKTPVVTLMSEIEELEVDAVSKIEDITEACEEATGRKLSSKERVEGLVSPEDKALREGLYRLGKIAASNDYSFPSSMRFISWAKQYLRAGYKGY